MAELERLKLTSDLQRPVCKLNEWQELGTVSTYANQGELYLCCS